ncbi:hypothetical protein [Helicobacter sp. T3_23-1056]
MTAEKILTKILQDREQEITSELMRLKSFIKSKLDNEVEDFALTLEYSGKNATEQRGRLYEMEMLRKRLDAFLRYGKDFELTQKLRYIDCDFCGNVFIDDVGNAESVCPECVAKNLEWEKAEV